MNMDRKKELANDWKQRTKEMGIIVITCKANGAQFATGVPDTKNVFNRHRFELEAGSHRNKELQKLWNKFGVENFTFEVVLPIEMDENKTDRANREDVKKLFEEYLLENPEV